MKNFSQNFVKTALCGVVGSERIFSKMPPIELAKIFLPRGRKQRAETAVSIALLVSRRVGIFRFCGTDDIEGSQTQPEASLF